MGEKEKGITLVALIITIILLLILVGIVITLSIGENGILTRAKDTKQIHEKIQAKEELELKIISLQTKITKEEMRFATLEDFYNLINEDVELTYIDATYKEGNPDKEYETIKVLYKGYIFTVDPYLIIRDYIASDSINVDLSYEIKAMKQVEEKILYTIVISLNSDQKIKKVEYENQILKDNNETKELLIDFEAEKDVKYSLKITSANNKVVEKTFVVNKEMLLGIELNKTTLDLGKGEEETLEVKILPENSFYSSIEWKSSSPATAKVDNNGKVTGTTLTATAKITVTVKDGINTYTEECLVTVDEIITGYVIEAEGYQSGNAIAINEIELFNSNDTLLKEHYYGGKRSDSSFNNFKIEAYELLNSKPPGYWERTVWGKTNLFDGITTYGESSSTIFSYNMESISRIFIYKLSEEVNKIKIFSGSANANGRYPLELSVYEYKGLKIRILNEILKEKDNYNNMKLWSKQKVSTNTAVIAENIFTRP